MKDTKVLVVGIGGIGFRHFQSLMTETRNRLSLFLVDVDKVALDRAQEYAIDNINQLIDITYLEDVSLIKEDIDIAIIATSSLVRRKVFEILVDRVNVTNIIFEKFLFPKISDYFEVKSMLDEKGIRAFVNCPCRLFPGYNVLKEELVNIKHLNIILSGSDWGMACNAIHTIDVVGFLLDCYDELRVDASMLDNEVIKSKRNGYIEFTGRLICEMGDKASIIFDSDKTGQNPFKLTIYGGNKIYTISEVNQKMNISAKGKCIEREFPIFYQSQLTKVVVDDLIERCICGLTMFEDTIQWHVALLEAFSLKYKQISKVDDDICPIT